jgi:hypothetical protein
MFHVHLKIHHKLGIQSIYVFSDGAMTVSVHSRNIINANPNKAKNADVPYSQGPHVPETQHHNATKNDDEDSDSESDSSDYLSFEESDGEDVHPETKAEREARAHERQLVLEAAGLIVKQNDKPPPSLIRARSVKRRPAPVAPRRKETRLSISKELPPVPEPEPEPEPLDHARRLDDAFERYESFKSSQTANRMSMASTLSADTLPSSPTLSVTPSRERESGEGRYSRLLDFLGRGRTPEGEKEKPSRNTATLNISAPIMVNSADSSEPSRAVSPAFGSVSFRSSFLLKVKSMLIARCCCSLGRVWLIRPHLKGYLRASGVGKR